MLFGTVAVIKLFLDCVTGDLRYYNRFSQVWCNANFKQSKMKCYYCSHVHYHYVNISRE